MRNYDISFSIDEGNDEFWNDVQDTHFGGDRCKLIAERIQTLLKDSGIVSSIGVALTVKETGGDLTWDQLCDLGGGHPGMRHRVTVGSR